MHHFFTNPFCSPRIADIYLSLNTSSPSDFVGSLRRTTTLREMLLSGSKRICTIWPQGESPGSEGSEHRVSWKKEIELLACLLYYRLVEIGDRRT